MQTILHNCCGLDVHKDSVVACILKTSNASEDNNIAIPVDIHTTFRRGELCSPAKFGRLEIAPTVLGIYVNGKYDKA